MDANLVSTLAAVASCASALAAWRSSAAARQAVAHSHAPFVWPAVYLDPRGEEVAITVRFYNDGPGIALDPTSRLFQRQANGPPVETWQSPAVRSMRGGEVAPDLASPPLEAGLVGLTVDGAYFETRWTDTSGRRWSTTEPINRAALADPPRRVGRRWRGRWLQRPAW